jgi:CRISPR type III-A-associated RAMP protein Csm5
MNTQHVLIETLTPLHVGSGRLLQGNTEYLYFSAAGTVALVDERKVLDLIGEENLDQWLRIIENEQDLLDYIRKRRPTLSPADVARRVIRVVGTKTPQKWHREGRERFPTIREQLFSGNGQPILPGSSLKGAIRTAVLNALIQQIPTAARTITAFKTVDEREDYRSGQLKRLIKYKGGTLEKKYAGPDPNHDVFRFLRIGDAHFEETVCLLSETLNERGNGTFEMKDEVKQFLECIPKGAEALCRVQIPAELKARLNEPRYRETAGKIPHRDRIEWPRLLADINANTKRLIEKEQRRYQSQSLPDEASAYLETLGELTKNLQPNQCVLRVGFGTGYLNMTGGWAEEQWRETLTPEKFKETRTMG